MFSDEELEALRSFPPIGEDELIRFFTLTPADEAFLRKFLRPQTVLGAAVQLCTLPWLGFVPDEVTAAPLAALPAERRRYLAQIGRRLTAQALVRREPNRRHPILLTLLAQSAVDVLDSVVQLFDQTLSGSESRARIKLRDELAERAKLSEDRLALLEEILPVLADAGIPDEAVGTLLRGKIGMSRLRTAYAGATARLSRDHGHLRLLEGSYTYIRQFAPKVLEAVRLAGGTEAKPLIEAVGILRELNATGARNVPDTAPTLFVPAQWQLHRAEFCRLVGKSPDASEALALVMDELDAALGDLEGVLKRGDGPISTWSPPTGTTCCGSRARSSTGTPPPPWSSASCPHPPGRTRSPRPSRSTGPFVARSTQRSTCRTRHTGARSPDSSTRASPSTPCAASFITPARARSPGASPISRTSRRGA
ncbi:hypothetical protein P3T36_007100 [Kitasatospora sp. MAP12-15]|nr:hypothetical protein [Kitasatospora sp. MAP12-44]